MSKYTNTRTRRLIVDVNYVDLSQPSSVLQDSPWIVLVNTVLRSAIGFTWFSGSAWFLQEEAPETFADRIFRNYVSLAAEFPLTVWSSERSIAKTTTDGCDSNRYLNSLVNRPCTDRSALSDHSTLYSVSCK